MRTTWNGSLSFGLVSIPVGLAPATKPAARQSDVSFRLLHRECGTPIKQKRWCPVHDREVGPDEIVKGWEVAKGQFVLVEEADLEALERSDDSRSIEITQFVRLEERRPDLLRPHLLPRARARRPRSAGPYVLLLEAMKQTGAAALGRFVRSGRESLCLVRARGDALALETLFLAEDVYSQAEIDEAVADADVKEAELQLARQVIVEPGGAVRRRRRCTSEYRRDLRALLEAKLAGEEIAMPRAEPRRRARRRPDGGAAGERRRREGEAGGRRARSLQRGRARSAAAARRSLLSALS